MTVELLTIDLNDYLKCKDKRIEDYEIKGVEVSKRNRVGSGCNLPSITNLESESKSKLINNLPSGTEVVVSIKKHVSETPSGFLSEGLQYVSYSGVALVPKNL
jgi:hypothetical protein